MGNSNKKGSDESMDSQMEEADLRARLLQVRSMRGLAAFRRAMEEDKQEVLRRWNEAVGIEPRRTWALLSFYTYAWLMLQLFNASASAYTYVLVPRCPLPSAIVQYYFLCHKDSLFPCSRNLNQNLGRYEQGNVYTWAWNAGRDFIQCVSL